MNAFPEPFDGDPGMTLRQYVAISAVQGMLANDEFYRRNMTPGYTTLSPRFVVVKAYQIADEFIKQGVVHEA